MARPPSLAAFEPDKGPEYLPATLAFGLVQGRPFVDRNKCTAYLIANEYQKALGLSEPDESVEQVAQRYMDAAARYGQVKDLVYHTDGSFDNGEGSKELTGGDRAAVLFNLFVRAVVRSTMWK